jgi:hypothetical protein
VIAIILGGAIVTAGSAARDSNKMEDSQAAISKLSTKAVQLSAKNVELSEQNFRNISTQLDQQFDKSKTIANEMSSAESDIGRNLAATRAVLAKTQRAAAPFKGMQFLFEFDIPSQDSVKAYLERLKGTELLKQVVATTGGGQINIDSTQSEYPDPKRPAERPLATLASIDSITVSVYRKGHHREPSPDLFLSVKCREDATTATEKLNASKTYLATSPGTPSRDEVTIFCVGDDVEGYKGGTEFASYRDFDAAFIELGSFRFADTPPLEFTFRALFRPPNGMGTVFPELEKTVCRSAVQPDAFCFVGTLANSFRLY